MALSRAQKETLIADYESGLAQASHAFLLGFSGLSVPQDAELRIKVRETGGSYQVVKNRLARRAIAGKALAELGAHFTGPTAVAYGDGDAVALAKALTEFVKQVPALEFKAGLVERQVLGAEEIKQIADLPSREQLVAKLVYLLASPLTGLARSLAAINRSLVVVLEQIRQGKAAQG